MQKLIYPLNKITTGDCPRRAQHKTQTTFPFSAIVFYKILKKETLLGVGRVEVFLPLYRLLLYPTYSLCSE